jgi:hydroxymethylpyrimidine pyrophosphatase-like HAD family hydrolase
LLCNQEKTASIATRLNTIVPKNLSILPIDCNYEHGFISISASDADKTTGVRALLEQYHTPTPIIMIGDSIADYIRLPNVHVWAVANAQIEMKQRADKVATRPYAQGCVELLHAIS